MILTQEKILEYAKLEEAIKERCEAFLGPSFHLTNFEINDTHISIWGEDDHREPFTDYSNIPLQEFCNTQYYLSMLDIC
jgi:hypothetical protein